MPLFARRVALLYLDLVLLFMLLRVYYLLKLWGPVRPCNKLPTVRCRTAVSTAQRDEIARKVLIELFQKFAVSKGRALVAVRRRRNLLLGVFFLIAFSFSPCVSKEKVGKKSYVATRLFSFYL